ncbi:MAG: hypothetical protein K6G91_00460 [Kiritimatiellae bacterium]|nr:hypothetical protein [Kiritimatiellia bacterium]
MKKNGLTTLPPSLQAEVDAIKAQEDEKYRVDALMRLTRKLYMGLKPTARNLGAIMDDVSSALYYWMFGGVEKEDSPILGKRRDPYQEDIQWLIPFTEFVRKFDGMEYLVKSTNFKIIDRAISNLYSELYELGQNHKYLCDSVWCRSYQKGVWWEKVSDIGLRRLSLDIIIMALAGVTDLADERAPEDSYLSQEWRKLEDELRRMAGLPSKQKPAAASGCHAKIAQPKEVTKSPDNVVRAIKVVERKVDNVSRNQRKVLQITKDINKRLYADEAATDHDNECEFKPDFTGKVDEDLLKDAWENVHPDSMKGKRQSACLNIYKKTHPKATTKDKAFVSFYNVIMYQLKREIQHSQL